MMSAAEALNGVDSDCSNPLNVSTQCPWRDSNPQPFP